MHSLGLLIWRKTTFYPRFLFWGFWFFMPNWIQIKLLNKWSIFFSLSSISCSDSEGLGFLRLELFQHLEMKRLIKVPLVLARSLVLFSGWNSVISKVQPVLPIPVSKFWCGKYHWSGNKKVMNDAFDNWLFTFLCPIASRRCAKQPWSPPQNLLPCRPGSKTASSWACRL